jgi:hypothetical protein
MELMFYYTPCNSKLRMRMTKKLWPTIKMQLKSVSTSWSNKAMFKLTKRPYTKKRFQKKLKKKQTKLFFNAQFFQSSSTHVTLLLVTSSVRNHHIGFPVKFRVWGPIKTVSTEKITKKSEKIDKLTFYFKISFLKLLISISNSIFF